MKLLTKKKEIDYYEYINKVKENTVARKVKIADIEHNLDRSRLDIITDKDIKREEKYKNVNEQIKFVPRCFER